MVELCAEPGEYTYQTGTQPSLLSGSPAQKTASRDVLRAGSAVHLWGQAAADQRIYYFNTKGAGGQQIRHPSPVPFRVVDQRAGIDMDIGIRCFGEYSYRVVNPSCSIPMACGNISEPYTRDTIDGQLKTELMTACSLPLPRSAPWASAIRLCREHTAELAQAPERHPQQPVEPAAWHRDRFSGLVQRQGQRGRRAGHQRRCSALPL